MNVLIADDDPIFRRLLQRLLERWGFVCSTVSNGVAALEQLQCAEAPQLAVLDWTMPGLDGLEVVQKLRATKSQPYTYVLLLTAKQKKCEIIEALRAGCDDCLSKPFDPEELQARLFVGKRILALEARLTDALKITQYQASHDALTGICNRGAILEALQRELQRGSRQQGSMSVIMLDLDHFKTVNDTFGHLAGDQVLQEVAVRIKGSLRGYDRAGRFGGEEFLVVLPDCRLDEAVRVADRIAESLRGSPVRALQENLTITASLGVATSKEGTGMQALLHAADCALYKAKAAGRNRIEFQDLAPFHSDLLETMPKQVTLCAL